MGKRWRIRPHDVGLIAQMERSTGVPPVVAQLLVCRGILNPDDVRVFLDPKLNGLRDPDLLPGIPDAAVRIHEAIQQNRRIVIYGDYDADGMTATAILYNCLTMLNADVGYYVPNRLDDGYGLNNEALKTLASRGASLVITVDCGISAIEQADTARDLGLELIITDHHQLADRLPDAAAIVHPRLPGHSYPFAGLCGAGVAFKLAWAVCQRASDAKKVQPHMREFLMSAIGLAAIGTVADVVPLVDENRILVKHGLWSLQQAPGVGIQQLSRVTKLDQKSALSSEDIAFTLAPRLNAAGRLGQAQLAVELLVTKDDSRAKSLAEYIHELNSSRDSLERSIYKQAATQLKEQFDPEADPALILAGHGWHAGVIGIVAGRMAEKYNRPTIIISLDELGVKAGTGSARSACGLDLYQALTSCEQHLKSFGGHVAAAGLSIDESEVDAFRASFFEYAENETTNEDRVAELCIDVETPLSQLTMRVVKQIEQLAPFGQGNPRPVLCAGDVELAETPRRMGGGDRHLSIKVRQHQAVLRGVAFGKGEWADELAQVDGPIDIAFRPVINEFRGRHNVELHLLDWRVSQHAAVPG
jgi:single-stranded-DNA-specific exonuclease